MQSLQTSILSHVKWHRIVHLIAFVSVMSSLEDRLSLPTVTRYPPVCTSVLPGCSVTSPELPSTSHLRAQCCNGCHHAGPWGVPGVSRDPTPSGRKCGHWQGSPGCIPHWPGSAPDPVWPPFSSCYSHKRCQVTTVFWAAVFLLALLGFLVCKLSIAIFCPFPELPFSLLVYRNWILLVSCWFRCCKLPCPNLLSASICVYSTLSTFRHS